MINSLTCSKVHLCHFVGVTITLCSFPTFLCTRLDELLQFTNVHGAMYYIPHSLHVIYCTEAVQTLRGFLTKLLRTNHEDYIVPVVSGGGPVPADLPVCLLHG